MRFPCKVKNKSGPKIVTWADGTDEEIAAMLEAHYNGDINILDYWTVGDKRTVSLSAMEATGVDESHIAQDVEYVLSNVGDKILSDGVTECVFQVDQVDALIEPGYMNSSLTNVGGWKDCARRSWCNSTYKNAIPSTLRGIFKECINATGTGGGSTSGTENTYDYFAYRAEAEIADELRWSVSGEGSQVEWYKTANNRIKKMNGEDMVWYERSPMKNNNSYFCCINTRGEVGITVAITCAIAVFGCI